MPLFLDRYRLLGHLMFVGVLAAATTLVAKEPSSPSGEQPAINQAEPEAAADEVETPFYGIGLEDTDRSVPRVTFVKRGSNIDEAGIEVGDLILEFGDVHDVPFDEFLKGIEETIRDTDNTDSIHVAYERDGRVAETEMEGFGRSTASLRRLKERSEKRVDEALSPDRQEQQQQQWSADQTVSTEMIEEYLLLKEKASQGTLRGADRARYDRLGGVVLGGYGGYGYGGYLGTNVPGTPANRAARVQAARQGVATSPNGTIASANSSTNANATAAGTGTGESRATVPGGANVDGVADSALRQEINTLRASQQQGELTEPQTRRLDALNRLSQSVGQHGQAGANSLNVGQRGANSQNIQPMTAAQQAQMRQLERGSRFGSLDTQQQQQPQRFRQQTRNRAAGRAGANNNMPRGAANASQGAQQNASPVQQGVSSSVGGSAAGTGQVPSSGIGK